MRIVLGFALCISAVAAERPTVVLTFDDAVKSHVDVVAPILKAHGFGATFFITHGWMDDSEHFLSWEDCATLHEMGFEIGNHTWTHGSFRTPRMGALLRGELALVEYKLSEVGVPKPISFAWPGNGFGPEALRTLEEAGYKLARRGMQPEIPYGAIVPGPIYDPATHHPLLIPTAGDAYPKWDLEHFKIVVDRAKDGGMVVLQFHGVPDVAHPWVHTPKEAFEEYMQYLADEDFRVIALRDLLPLAPEIAPDDPLAATRYPEKEGDAADLPKTVANSRADADYWVANMKAHGYSRDEMAEVFGANLENDTAPTTARVLPYPGGRHPRIGFLNGAVAPWRGTKASIFAPWGGYVVVDLPEAIFSNLGLMYLAHTHIPTMWDDANVVIEDKDWTRLDDGSLVNEWKLPNGVVVGAEVAPTEQGADFLLWLKNGSDAPLTGLRTQICAMFRGMSGMNGLTNDNKTLDAPIASARNDAGDRWTFIAFEHCGRAWANAKCPCMHSDPVLPDAAKGTRVETRGRLVFFEGGDPSEVIRALTAFAGPTAE